MLGRLRTFFGRIKARVVFGRPAVVFGPFTVVEPRKVTIGRNLAINHGVFILGSTGITIGDDVVLSARVMLIDGGLDPRDGFGETETRHYRKQPIVIGDGVWIGAGAIILPGVTIGDRAVVGAGSVVTRPVAAGTIVAGNPARQIGSTSRG